LARFEIGRHDGSEFLLPRSVPDTKSSLLFVKIHLFVSEVDDSHGLIGQRLVFNVSPEEGGLAHSTVSNEDDLVGGTVLGSRLGRHLIKIICSKNHFIF
jgi:hypothetical protein